MPHVRKDDGIFLIGNESKQVKAVWGADSSRLTWTDVHIWDGLILLIKDYAGQNGCLGPKPKTEQKKTYKKNRFDRGHHLFSEKSTLKGTWIAYIIGNGNFQVALCFIGNAVVKIVSDCFGFWLILQQNPFPVKGARIRINTA